VRRHREQPFAEELAERHDDDHIGLELFDLVEDLGRIDLLGGNDGREPLLRGVRLAGARGEALPPPGGAIRLRHNADHFEQRRLQDRPQRGGRGF
jgi:hypothetical protein